MYGKDAGMWHHANSYLEAGHLAPVACPYILTVSGLDPMSFRCGVSIQEGRLTLVRSHRPSFLEHISFSLT
jgi:hypothetical protein